MAKNNYQYLAAFFFWLLLSLLGLLNLFFSWKISFYFQNIITISLFFGVVATSILIMTSKKVWMHFRSKFMLLANFFIYYNIVKIVFATSLLFFVINTFLSIEENLLFNFVFLLFITSGLLFFWLSPNINRKEYQTINIFSSEGKMEKHRNIKFNEKFKKINKIPLASKAVKWLYAQGTPNAIFIIVVSLIFLLFSIKGLADFMTVDEWKWFFKRVPSFIHGLRTGDLALTYVNDKPGITSVILSSVPIFLLNPISHIHYLANHYIDYDVEAVKSLFFYARIPIIFFNLIITLFVYQFSKILFNKKTGIAMLVLMATSINLIGVSQILNPDSTLPFLFILSLILYFLLLKTGQKKYLYYTGISLGLMSMSKFSGNILYSFMPLAIPVFYALCNIKVSFNKYFSDEIKNFFYIILISLFVIYILSPFYWNSPVKILEFSIFHQFSLPLVILSFIGIIISSKLTAYAPAIKRYFNIVYKSFYYGFLLGIVIVLLNFTFFDFRLFDFQSIRWPDSVDINANIIKIFFVNLSGLIFSNSLVILSLFILALLLLRKKDPYWHLYLWLLLIIFIYISGSSYKSIVTNSRYLIILYPIIYLIIANFLSSISSKRLFYSILSIVLVANLFSLSQTKYYLTYKNSLVPNNIFLSDAWGYGGKEIADYLNNLPNSDKITVWADREGFAEFFNGKYLWRSNSPFANEEKPDYLMLTKGGKRIIMSDKENNRYYKKFGYLLEKYYKQEGEISIFINNNPNNYIKLVRFE